MTTRPRTSRLRSSFITPLLGIALIGSALAGCASAGVAPTGSGSTPAAAASSSAASSATPVTSGDALCALVSVDAANAAVKPASPFTEQAAGTFVNGEPECGFTTADRSIILNVTVFDTASTTFDLQHGVVGDDTLHAISGVGDRAAVGRFELDAVVGTRGLVVENFTDGGVTAEQLTALAKLFAPRI